MTSELMNETYLQLLSILGATWDSKWSGCVAAKSLTFSLLKMLFHLPSALSDITKGGL